MAEFASLRAEIVPPDWLARRSAPRAPVDDVAAMRLAIELSLENVERNSGGPFAALVRDDATGRIVSVGVNRVAESGNPTLHAEVMALTLAGAAGADFKTATLVSSCAPCIMCLGATHWSGVQRVLYAALKEDAEAMGFSEGAGTDVLEADMRARGVRFDGGFMREAALEVFRRYVATRGLIYGPRT